MLIRDESVHCVSFTTSFKKVANSLIQVELTRMSLTIHIKQDSSQTLPKQADLDGRVEPAGAMDLEVAIVVAEDIVQVEA